MAETPALQDFRPHIEERLTAICRALGYDGALPGLADVPDGKPGDVSLPCFQLRGRLPELDDAQQKNPVAVASAIAERLEEDAIIGEVHTLGPYINIGYRTATLIQSTILSARDRDARFGGDQAGEEAEDVLVEFSAPNSNKPQHLGHVRNNLLGESVCRILDYFGHKVTRLNLINDRGIHICKSMLAYQLWGAGKTPQSEGIKGDHFVGHYYLLFQKRFAEEYAEWLKTDAADAAFERWRETDAGQRAVKARAAWEKAQAQPEVEGKKRKKRRREPPQPRAVFESDYKDAYFNDESPLGQKAGELLVKWEAEDAAVRELWSTLNGWVFEGFEETYARSGVSFDLVDRESETFHLGKEHVEDGLKRGIFFTREDGAVSYDLERMGRKGDKVVLRSNGTSVYITQDLGTAILRYERHAFDRLIYVVASEQDRHFQLLFAILPELRPELEGRLEHLSYGLVHLPEGRMKTSTGTVVNADDLFDEMRDLARAEIDGKLDTEHYQGVDEDELAHRAETIGQAALKYHLLDTGAPSDMKFDPRESLDFQGRTGAYCLFNYARTRSLIRKAGGLPPFQPELLGRLGTDEERRVVTELAGFPRALEWAASQRDPSKLSEYLFRLCKAFAFIFTDRQGHPIATCEDPELRAARLFLVDALGAVLERGLALLGIETLEEM